LKNLFQSNGASFSLVLILIAVLWSVSSFGYYVLVDALDKPGGYNDGPRIFSLYYAVWCLVALALFHPALSAWGKTSSPPEDRIAPVLMITGFAVFAFAIVPLLPTAAVPTDRDVNEIITAQPWYFLPKTVEIFFQQILMIALVVALAAQNMRLGRITILTAALFGSFHLALVLNGDHPFYVLRYTIAATLFGAATPAMVLRMRNGLVYSFSLHWAWYALDTMIWRFVFPAT